jgi:polar amino acid transport system permease protein
MTGSASLEYLPPLLDGCLVTLEVTALSAVLACCVALPAGLARMAPWRPVRWLAATYIEVFRGTSALVQMFFFFYALPILGLTFSPLVAGVLTIGLNAGSYGAEVVRGAVLAVPAGQSEAAIALNMTRLVRMRFVVLPQALVAMLPPAGNLLIELLKTTALVSLITLSDLTFQGQLLRTRTGDTVTIFAIVMVMYFLMAYAITLGIRALERRVGTGLDTGRVARVVR